MRAFRLALVPLLLLSACEDVEMATGAGAGAPTSAGSAGGGGGGGGLPDIDVFLEVPKSCAYMCQSDGCPEKETPYACPALAAWDALPHGESCPAWDGVQPVATTGVCSATDPSGAALARPGKDAQDPKAYVLPDGRKTRPAGAMWAFDEPELYGGTTSGIAAVAGTPFVLTVDTGTDDHAVRAVDTSKIGVEKPVTAALKFARPKLLNSSIAFVPPGRAYVATSYGVVQALSFDLATGALALDDEASLPLPETDPPWYVAGVAASPDGKRLVVTSQLERLLFVFDIDPASPTYKAQLGSLDIESREAFGVYIDPLDTAGTRAYVPVWSGRRVVEIALDDPTKPAVARTFATEQNPQGITFLDGTWMVVANDLGETLSLVDRVSGEVTPVPVDFAPDLRGLDVSGVAFDKGSSRLYALLSGINAVAAYDVDTGSSPPSLELVGRLGTGWWPSSMVIAEDGSLTLTNLRGRPIGVYEQDEKFGGPGTVSGHKLMRGSVQQIAAPSAAELAAGAAEVEAAVAVSDLPGYPEVECAGGAMDFPIPPTNTMGPSKAIDRIVFIVRENKTFDAVFGDLPGVAGSPAYTLKETTEDMEKVWPNFRDLARAFTNADNFYNVAVQSTQGHQWTTYGRTTDFCERTWGDEARPVPLCGVGEIGRPDEGGLFDWLQKGGVRYDILGEIVGIPSVLPAEYNPVDGKYPGGPFQTIPYPDIEKSCYFAARQRVACNLGAFTYMTLPNDHTLGVDPSSPTPETMCAINDEATGMVVDALSHSPYWASSLIVITEDDPQQGGDHIDYHRTPLLLISPWVKRGYVTSTHIDMASLYKLYAHILGLPYPNVQVAKAGLPLDAFTSSPDYTPWDYRPHAWPIGCGALANHIEQRVTRSWDFSVVDAQEGLGEQVMRWMRGRQLTSMPADLEVRVAAREARKAAGLPPILEDEDEDDD